MIRVAIEFSKRIAGFRDTKSLCRIQDLVKIALFEFDQMTAQLKRKALLQISLCEVRLPHNLNRRLILLPEAIKKGFKVVKTTLFLKWNSSYVRTSKVLKGRQFIPTTPSAW